MKPTALFLGALLFCACSSNDAMLTTVDAATASTDGPPGRCTARLVRLRTGPDSACGGQNAHFWPIGLAATDCHGWRAVDTTGRQHDNSANAIRCNTDGSFTFTQFAGNLNCTGTGTVKTYRLNMCERDTPPSLYTVADDLTCCSAPDSDACVRGTPSVSVAGATIYLNGTTCAN